MASSTIEESDRLLDMINTMLLISKAESGDAQFVFEEINISEIIKDKVNALVVDYKDSEQIYNSILILSNDSILRDSIKDEGFITSRIFGVEIMINELTTMYNEVY